MNRRIRHKVRADVAKATKITVMVPKVLEPSVFVAVEIEDAGFDRGSGCYVARFGFGARMITNEFDPKDVPMEALGYARHMTNCQVLRRFGLDLPNAVPLAS